MYPEIESWTYPPFIYFIELWDPPPNGYINTILVDAWVFKYDEEFGRNLGEYRASDDPIKHVSIYADCDQEPHIIVIKVLSQLMERYYPAEEQAYPAIDILDRFRDFSIVANEVNFQIVWGINMGTHIWRRFYDVDDRNLMLTYGTLDRRRQQQLCEALIENSWHRWPSP